MRIVEVRSDDLDEYSRIPCAFTVREKVDLELLQSTGEIVGNPVTPFVKDYDLYEAERPDRLSALWNLSNWGIFLAHDDDFPSGGAIVALDTPALARPGVGLLQDVRVSPSFRGHGLGTKLVERATEWSRSKGCSDLLVETQDINVAACRLYKRYGFRIQAVDHAAYPDLDEVRLLWTLAL